MTLRRLSQFSLFLVATATLVGCAGSPPTDERNAPLPILERVFAELAPTSRPVVASVPEGLRVRLPDLDADTDALLTMLARFGDETGRALDVDTTLDLMNEAGELVPVTTRVVLGASAREDREAPPVEISEARSHVLVLVRGGDGIGARSGANVEVAASGFGQAFILAAGKGGEGASPSAAAGGAGGFVVLRSGDAEPVALDVLGTAGDGGDAYAAAKRPSSPAGGLEGSLGEAEQALNGAPGTPGAPTPPSGGNGTAGGNGVCPGPCNGGNGGDGGTAIVQVGCSPVTNFINVTGGSGGLGGDGGVGVVGSPAGGNGGRGGSGGNAEAHCRPQHPSSIPRSCRARARGGDGGNAGKGGDASPASLATGGNGGQAGHGGDASAMGCCTNAITSFTQGGSGGLGGRGGDGCPGGNGGCGGHAGLAVTNVVQGTFSGGGATALSGNAGPGGDGGDGALFGLVCGGGNGGNGGPTALALATNTCGAPFQLTGLPGVGGAAGIGNYPGGNGVAGLANTDCLPSMGCSDGTEEGFGVANACPDIAACSGGWSRSGILGTPVAACGHVSGNSSANPTGAGCTVTDLCGNGFHVCRDDGDVSAHVTAGCTSGPVAGRFFATAQSTNGGSRLALGANITLAQCDGSPSQCGCLQTMWTANDLAGVGGMGTPTACGPVGVTRLSGASCANLQGFNCPAAPGTWSCPGAGFNEAHTVTKGSSACGGVLCCRNP